MEGDGEREGERQREGERGEREKEREEGGGESYLFPPFDAGIPSQYGGPSVTYAQREREREGERERGN